MVNNLEAIAPALRAAFSPRTLSFPDVRFCRVQAKSSIGKSQWSKPDAARSVWYVVLAIPGRDMPIARRKVIWKSFIDNELQTPYPMPYPTRQEHASRNRRAGRSLFCRDRNYRNVNTRECRRDHGGFPRSASQWRLFFDSVRRILHRLAYRNRLSGFPMELSLDDGPICSISWSPPRH
jgi:hypothetical protein